MAGGILNLVVVCLLTLNDPIAARRCFAPSAHGEPQVPPESNRSFVHDYASDMV